MQIPRTGIAAMAGEDPQPGLEEIFLAHKDLVFRAAYRVTGNAGDAEDVLQTVFLRLARQETLSEIDNLPAYLHRSAVNASLDLLRRSKESRTLSLDDEKTTSRPSQPIPYSLRPRSGTGCGRPWDGSIQDPRRCSCCASLKTTATAKSPA